MKKSLFLFIFSIIFISNFDLIKNDTSKKDSYKIFLENICEEYDIKQCTYYCNLFIKQSEENFIKLINIPNSKKNLFILSEAYFYKGLYEFYGLNDKNTPNLEIALKHFIISSYLKNPKANYRLFIIYDTDLIFHIIYSKKFINILNTDNIIQLITKSEFWNNFNIFYKYPNNNYLNETIRRQLQKSIGHNFLYLSAFKKYNPAMLTLGIKYLYGIGVEENCNISYEYIKESAYNIVNKRINNEELYGSVSFNNFNLENYENIENTYKDYYSELDELIQYYKIKKDKSLKSTKKILKEIILRYFYGISTKKDYDKAKKWLEICIQYKYGFCYAYLGEIYLFGYGSQQKNYEKAFIYFNNSITYDEKALGYTGLGYMSYYGFYVKKDKQKAYTYFIEGIRNSENGVSIIYSNLFYNMITLLIEEDPNNNYFKELLKDPLMKNIYINKYFKNFKNKNFIEKKIKEKVEIKTNEKKVSKDFDLAYKYANLLTLNNKIYGTYILAMMNNYNIKSKLDNCYENTKILLKVTFSDKELINRMKLLKNLYKEKKYKSMYLVNLEMVYEGLPDGLTNVISLLNKHKIFNDKSYQKYMTYYFIEYLLKTKTYNLYALYNSAEFFYANKIYDKAIELYKILINVAAGNENNFYISNGYYYLGMIENFGYGGISKNITKANYFFEKSLYYDNLSEFPIKFIKFLNKISSLFNLKYNENNQNDKVNLNIIQIIKNIIKYCTKLNLLSVAFTSIFSFYIWFYFNLKKQDSK